MIPLNRKERYLNQIVGWGNTAPEKPQTPEEFFFSAILGEDVQLPDLKNATRYELFLAKIAGININISPPTYTSPRIEFFLARAAGMNVPELVPLTREEIFWSNYVAVVEKILEGLPPLTYKAKKAGTLTDYRIYGQTSRNLFDGEFLQGYWADADGLFVVSNKWISTKKVPCKANAQYTFSSSFLSRWAGFFWYDENDNYLSNDTAYNSTLLTETSPSNAAYMAIDIAGYPTWDNTISPSDVTDLMLVEGSTPLPYEPYGESVGDRTGNLVYKRMPNTNVYANGKVIEENDFDLVIAKVAASETYTVNGIHGVLAFFVNEPALNAYSYDGSRVLVGSNTQYTFTVPLNCNYVAVRVLSSTSEVMLNFGSEPLPYEPYGYKVPVTVEGKNLLQNTATSQTINGVTFTVNSDGSVTCNTDENGATGAAVFIVKKPIYLDSTTQCILAGCPNGGGANTYRIQYADSVSRAISDYGSSITFFPFDASAYPEQNIAIVISENTVCNNLTFYPMIRKADITDNTYEPYITDTELNVTLPALPTLTGTNVLSVGTEVQPSNVYIEYEGVRGE